MHIYRHYRTLPDEARGAAIAVGNFDGVHKGHQAVIGEAGRIARAGGLPWAVLTFEPHPRRIFQPDQPPFRLTPMRAKARALEALGVDAMIVQRFNRDFSQQPAEAFVQNVLADGFGANHVVAGYDFVFGHKRGGNCELLLSMGKSWASGSPPSAPSTTAKAWSIPQPGSAAAWATVTCAARQQSWAVTSPMKAAYPMEISAAGPSASQP